MKRHLVVCCQICSLPIKARFIEEDLYIICEECLKKSVKALRK